MKYSFIPSRPQAFALPDGLPVVPTSVEVTYSGASAHLGLRALEKGAVVRLKGVPLDAYNALLTEHNPTTPEEQAAFKAEVNSMAFTREIGFGDLSVPLITEALRGIAAGGDK